MARRKNIFKKGLNANIGWILVVLLVAGTSFLLGSSTNKKTEAEQTATKQPTQTQSVVSDISSTLQNPLPSQASNNTVPITPSINGVVNINTASLNQLDTLPGIGPSYAQAIINYRSTNGPFVRIEDIQKIKGIGPKTFEKLKSRITI